jgi:hypothetical protein
MSGLLNGTTERSTNLGSVIVTQPPCRSALQPRAPVPASRRKVGSRGNKEKVKIVSLSEGCGSKAGDLY